MQSETTLLDFALPYQKKFITNKKKRKIWLSSRQIGKSWTAAFIANQKALTKKNGLTLCISTGSRAASELLKKCAQMAEACHILDPEITYSASADQIKFTSGSRVISLPSGNPAALRGWSAQCIVIDEGAFIDNPDEVWSAISPTLLRDPDAEVIICTTPGGMQGWFYDFYTKALDSDDWYVQTTTVEDAVKDGLKVDIPELKKTISDPQIWDQEFMCKFAAEYGAMLDTGLLEFSDTAPQKCSCRFCGVDIGAVGDRTAIVDAMQLDDGSYFIDEITMLHKADYQTQLDVLKQLYQKNKWSSGYIDSVGIGNPIAEFAGKQITARLKGYTWTAQNKPNAYEHLRSLVFDHKIVFAQHLKQLVVSDFRNVHRIVSESGKVSYQAGRDENGHSDATSALVLALMAAKELPGNAQAPVATPFPSAFGNFISRSAPSIRI